MWKTLPKLTAKKRSKRTHYMRLPAASNNKIGKKEKFGKGRFTVFSCPAFPASRAAAFFAGKSGSLGLFIFSRTFRKIEITVSDNDPWGMIQKPVSINHGGRAITKQPSDLTPHSLPPRPP